MTVNELPILIEPEQLQPLLGHPQLLIVDLCRPGQYPAAHIPGAVHLPYSHLMLGQTPAPGKLPAPQQIAHALGAIGLTPQHHVVAYDDEGGGWAGRLLWTLDVIGHANYSYLNGGLQAWARQQRPLQTEAAIATATQLSISYRSEPMIDKAGILSHLQDPNWVIWDARSPEEYFGLRPSAAQNGHMPGAVNYEWTRAMDPNQGFRIRDLETVRQELAALGITADKNIITHCQAHHRSAFTYLLGKILGFPSIRAYPGAWSEWGNDPDTPIELDSTQANN